MITLNKIQMMALNDFKVFFHEMLNRSIKKTFAMS